MATTKVFETALNAGGYYTEGFRYGATGEVETAYGVVNVGNVTKKVRWNSRGECFTRNNVRMPRFDLDLQRTAYYLNGGR